MKTLRLFLLLVFTVLSAGVSAQSRPVIPDVMGYEALLCDFTDKGTTLAFVKEKSEAGVREAKENGRTVVLKEGKVIGPEKLLKALLEASLSFHNPLNTDGNRVNIAVENSSDLDFVLARVDNPVYLYPLRTTIEGGKASRYDITLQEPYTGPVKIAFIVENFCTPSGEPISCAIELNARKP